MLPPVLAKIGYAETPDRFAGLLVAHLPLWTCRTYQKSKPQMAVLSCGAPSQLLPWPSPRFGCLSHIKPQIILPFRLARPCHRPTVGIICAITFYMAPTCGSGKGALRLRIIHITPGFGTCTAGGLTMEGAEGIPPLGERTPGVFWGISAIPSVLGRTGRQGGHAMGRCQWVALQWLPWPGVRLAPKPFRSAIRFANYRVSSSALLSCIYLFPRHSWLVSRRLRDYGQHSALSGRGVSAP